MENRPGPEAGHTVSRHADATAVLSDPRFIVPPARPGDGGARSMAWLRRTVCRFSEGPAHERRVGMVNEELARLDPAALRREARASTAPARTVAVEVLGRALGATDLDALSAAVPVAAAAYLTGDAGPAADAAVAATARLLGPGPGSGSGSDEAVANRVAVLIQACESTAALIAKAVPLARTLDDPAGPPADSIIAETLRFDPPVPVMRRVAADGAALGGRAVPAGSPVTLDLRAANRDPAVFTDPDRFDPDRTEPWHLTFGTGRRPCPGTAHALQLAAGALESILTKEALR